MDPAISRDDYRALRGDPRRWHDAITAVAARHGLGAGPVRPLGGSNLVASVGDTRVVKLFPPFLRYQWDSERVALAVLHGALAPVVTPELLHVGELDGWPYLVMTRLEGASLEDAWPEATAAEQVQLLAQIGALIAHVHALDPGPIAAIGPRWARRTADFSSGLILPRWWPDSGRPDNRSGGFSGFPDDRALRRRDLDHFVKRRVGYSACSKSLRRAGSLHSEELSCRVSTAVLSILPHPWSWLSSSQWCSVESVARTPNHGRMQRPCRNLHRLPEPLKSRLPSRFKASLEDSALRGLDSGLAAAGAATTGRLGAAAVWDEFDQETSEIELAAVPSCHGSVPNRYAAKARCSAITIAIRNNSLVHFSRADPGHFSRALKPAPLDGFQAGLDAQLIGEKAELFAQLGGLDITRNCADRADPAKRGPRAARPV